METSQKLGLSGAALLGIGAFCPLISIPIIGSVNYFMNGHGDGTIILVLAAAIGIAAFVGRYQFAAIGGVISLAMILYTFLRIRSSMSDMATEMGDNPFAALAQASIQMQWGWAILVLGAGLSIASYFNRQTA